MYIRTRLALWFMLILAVVISVFSVEVYQQTRSNLLGEIDRDVRQRANLLAGLARPAPGETRPHVPNHLDVFTAPDTFCEVLDVHGRVLARSGNLGARTLPLSPAALAPDHANEVRIGGVVLLLSARSVGVNGQIRGYVIVARAPRTIYQALARLRSVLYPGAATALVLAGLAAWLLVRRAMRPLEDLATTAAMIAATQDHTRRLRVPAPSLLGRFWKGGNALPARLLRRLPADEIGRLAVTINGMLQALEDAYRQMRELNDLQRQFLADVSHELRTPLTIMLSSLDLVGTVGATDPDFQARALADLRVEAERMARMVTQLLLLARTDAGAAATSEPLLIVDLLVDVCRQARPSENAAGLTCPELSSLEGAVVWGNADYLKQLFLILLDNAFKYTPAHGSVQLRADLAGEDVQVSVIDTGIGISAADLPRIFDRFYRAANARSSRGMGLGLAIARRLVEQHGGHIEVTSEEGRGSCFTVTLPLLNAASLRDEPSSSSSI